MAINIDLNVTMVESQNMNKMALGLANVSKKIESVQIGLSPNILNKKQIDLRLRQINNSCKALERDIRGIGSFLNYSVTKYNQIEYLILLHAKNLNNRNSYRNSRVYPSAMYKRIKAFSKVNTRLLKVSNLSSSTLSLGKVVVAVCPMPSVAFRMFLKNWISLMEKFKEKYSDVKVENTSKQYEEAKENKSSNLNPVKIILKDVPLFLQYDARWKNKNLGNSSSTMHRRGCLVTCIAMLESYRLNSVVTPLAIIENAKFTDGGNLRYTEPYNAYQLSYGDNKTESDIMMHLYEKLKSNQPVILSLDKGGNKFHFVVIYGMDNIKYGQDGKPILNKDNILVRDPENRIESLDQTQYKLSKVRGYG